MATRLTDIVDNAVYGWSHNVTNGTTNNTAGSSLDFVNAENPVTLFSNIQANATTAPSAALKAQESTDGTTWADITGASIAAATTNTTGASQFNRSLRYLRSYMTEGTSALVGVETLLIAHKKYCP